MEALDEELQQQEREVERKRKALEEMLEEEGLEYREPGERELEAEAERRSDLMRVTIEDVPVIIVTDPRADRMRAMTAIRSTDDIDPAELLRLMQANFDTALDARYAVANGRLWATFIHPLSPLERDQFISGLGQVVNLALTYGSLYTGGAMAFSGGDSPAIHRQLIDDLLKRGEPI